MEMVEIAFAALAMTLIFAGLCIWNFWKMFRPGEVQEWRYPAHAALGGLTGLSFFVTVVAFIWFLVSQYA